MKKARKFPVVLSSRADKMMLAHTEFLARVSPAASRKLLAAFKRAVNLLAKNPSSYPFADEVDIPNIPKKCYRKCLFYKRYKAIYIVEDDAVNIDVIIDCRQENQDLY